MARLPTPGSDDGTWGGVLNDFLLQAHNDSGALKPDTVGNSQLQNNAVDSSVVADGALTQNKVQNLTVDLAAKVDKTMIDAKGDLLVGSAVDTAIRVAAGVDGRVLTADSTQPAGVAWTTKSESAYPISAYGFIAVTDSIATHNGNSSVGPGVVRIFVPAGKAITAVGIFVRSVGTLGTGGLNGFAIYSDAGVLVETTASDDSLYTATGWRFLVLNSVIPAQTSDRFVRVHRAVSGYSSAPLVMYAVCGTSTESVFFGGYGVPNHRRVVYTGNISSWPASFDPVTYGTVTEYLPLMALA